VWLDAEEAIAVRWLDDAPHIERVAARDWDFARDGDPGQSRTEEDAAHALAAFIDIVAERLPRDDALLVLGPDRAATELAEALRARDEQEGVLRAIACREAPRMSQRRLVACLCGAIGHDPQGCTADEDLLGG
jgi:hypothetical protein